MNTRPRQPSANGVNNLRIWSIHPKYLDSQGLVALWRETLLAQKVLAGKTKGYKNHPQLTRFKQESQSLQMIGEYLYNIHHEATTRGYSFDDTKILQRLPRNSKRKIKVTSGQKKYEFEHLIKKLKIRSPLIYEKVQKTAKIELHPLFKQVRGGIERWEVIQH